MGIRCHRCTRTSARSGFSLVAIAAAALTLGTLLPAGLSTAALGQTNLVQNGNFVVTGGATSFQFGSFNNYVAPTETLAGWSSTGYNFVFLPTSTVATGTYGNLSLWSPASSTPSANGFTNASPTGGNFVGADSSNGYHGAMTQTINGLTTGGTYAVSFVWAGAQQSGYTGLTTEQWQVSLGTSTASTQIITVANQGFSGWMSQTFNFVATSSSEVLAFLANGTPSGVPPFALLSNVSMTKVPEPASIAIMLTGITALVGFARRRRQPVLVRNGRR